MPTRRSTLARLGKIPTTPVRRDLLIEPLLGVGRADPAAVQLLEGYVSELVGLGRYQQPGDLGVGRGRGVDHPVELLWGTSPASRSAAWASGGSRRGRRHATSLVGRAAAARA
jgi:hypothetical protein